MILKIKKILNRSSKVDERRALADCALPHLESLTPPVPPEVLSIQVLGRASQVQDFLYGGYVVAEGLKRYLELAGRPLHSLRRVLDFGCGSSRVLRWYTEYSHIVECFGADISEQAIDWNRSNMPFGEYVANGERPPLPFGDEYFDLVYGVSVVTHLDEETQLEWIRELRRILRPGGIAMLSVMGPEIAKSRLDEDEFAEFRKKGHYYKVVQPGGLHGLPDFYQDAYHSKEYVDEAWARYFEIVAYVRKGPLYLQDMIILRRPGHSEGVRTPAALELDLPIGVIDSPRIAAVAQGQELELSGWTFNLSRRPIDLDVLINGRKVGESKVNQSRPDVAQVFPSWPWSDCSGYSAVVPLTGLRPGPYRLNLTDRETAFPYLSTYFFIE
jgi:SAM-dependent methyltransferase